MKTSLQIFLFISIATVAIRDANGSLIGGGMCEELSAQAIEIAKETNFEKLRIKYLVGKHFGPLVEKAVSELHTALDMSIGKGQLTMEPRIRVAKAFYAAETVLRARIDIMGEKLDEELGFRQYKTQQEVATYCQWSISVLNAMKKKSLRNFKRLSLNITKVNKE